ncbi:MAG: glycosyltransferase family 39 protein [Anaerolineae bacterium]|nr:glycosyltransferase family 39 protein [Anaerolineae bacterium]
MSARRFLWGMVVLLLAAAALRLVAFDALPPGLYHDEAYHGLDALDILAGRLALYFPANNGREPLFIYCVAAAVGLLGQSPFALRIAAVPVGILTVAATAAMGRALFSRRVGLLAASVLAVTLWHVHLSRVGFRAVLLPLAIALFVTAAARAGRSGRRAHWFLAGALYGLSFYTYTAARFTPLALLACGAYLWLGRARFRFSLRNGQWAVVAALLVLAPLVAYTALHPDVVLGRLGQVWLFSPAIYGGDLWGTLGRHALRTAGMFFVRGDRIWRHNVPWRPVFDPVLGAVFLLGLAAALRRARREPAAGWVLIWTALMVLPTLLSEDAPHFLRSVGVLPVVAFLPALGLDWLASRLAAAGRSFAWSPVALVLLIALGSTAADYFSDYARDPMAGYWFERGAVALAGRVNAFLGTGWDGERMLSGEPQVQAVYVDPVLWQQWPQLRFLIAAPEAVTVGLAGETAGGAVAVLAWPYGEWRQAWALFPAPARVAVEVGPLSQGDRDPAPHVTYLAFSAAPVGVPGPAQARFERGVELLDVDVSPAGEERWQVRLCWRATAPLAEDYTVFLHYLRDGELLAQADGPPAAGYYPTTAWRPGDVICDDHFVTGIGAPLPERDVLRLGLWQPESGVSLQLLDAAGNPLPDGLALPLDGE